MKQQDERIELLSAIIDAYIEICDKNRSTIAKLMDAYQSVTAERDAAIEEIKRILRNTCDCQFCAKFDKDDPLCKNSECEPEWRGAGKESEAGK